MRITNFGDPAIGDCCRYLIQKTAAQEQIRVRVTVADVYEEHMDVIKKQLEGKHAVVFPGGGMNSVAFNERLLELYNLIERQPDTQVFFNAVGISRVNPKAGNERLLRQLFAKPQTAQITTRGDFAQLLSYVRTPRKYPVRLVIDPAIWAAEAYRVCKKPYTSKIGVGVIRPEIYEANGNSFSALDVSRMYIQILNELQKRGYEWELFTNGMAQDDKFGNEILSRMGLSERQHKKRNVKSAKQLVKRISGYRGVIAARLHANILAASLRIPSVGLVWNDKMNLFAEAIGAKERFIGEEQLLDAPYIVDQLELALKDGYREHEIAAMKEAAVQSVRNILH